MRKINVLVVDDSSLSRCVIEGLLMRDEDIEILAGASSLAEVEQRLAGPPVDVVTLDMSLTDGCALQMVDTLTRRHGCRVIVISGCTDLHRRASERGAVACFSKSELLDESPRFHAAVRGAAFLAGRAA